MAATTASVVIDTPLGQVRAIKESDLLRARGIPYATANRFETPKGVAKWSGVKDCTHPAPVCPQKIPTRLDDVTGPIVSASPQSEQDCLHLTVTAKLNAKDRPVLVFFHGGAFVSGGSDLEAYAPLELARRDLVVVNVSYRLGVFGYLPPIEGVVPANLGLRDQIAALQWIQDNIAAFGGDKGRVTIWGQSAGADSVFCLLVADVDRPLFHRGILSSSPFGSQLHDRFTVNQLLADTAKDHLQLLLHAQSAEEILNVQTTMSVAAKPEIIAFMPRFGEAPLPPTKDLPRIMRERAAQIPVLVTYTADEGTAFAPMVSEVAAVHDVPVLGWLTKKLVSWYEGRSMFQVGSRDFVRDYREAGGQATLGHFLWSARGNKLGSTHCLDLAFLLGSWSAWKDAPMLAGPGSEDEVRLLGQEMKELWSRFVGGDSLSGKDVVIDSHFEASTCF